MTRALPPSASVAQTLSGGKLHAPAAERNADAIAGFLAEHAPAKGHALEIASGTGQHVIAFAARLPDLTWQPTDVEPDRLRSINAYAAEADLENLHPARTLDATRAGWAADFVGQDLIVLINLLHLISADEARTVIDEAASALVPGGTLVLYGPFAREGKLTSPGDARFDADLRGANPLIGYKDTMDMRRWLLDAGLTIDTLQEMPANNLCFLSRKAQP